MATTASLAIPRPALLLGFAGLLPPLTALWAMMMLDDPASSEAMFTAIFAYTTLIFSFIGGVWWGFSSADGRRPGWADLTLAVFPSLAAFLTLPLVAQTGPDGAVLLALLVLVSPVIDLRFRRRGLAPTWWMRLRMPLSIGLSTLLGAAVWLVR
nr:DUF3429 domain-containing protein [Sphingomonas jejuensis]